MTESTQESGTPLFSHAALGGACPRCEGREFRKPRIRLGRALIGTKQHFEIGPISRNYFAVGKDARTSGIAGIMAASRRASEYVECVTCGKLFRKG